jgi:L-lactate dehydrogenase complex protein LldG
VAADEGDALSARDDVLARIRSALGPLPAAPSDVARAYDRAGSLHGEPLLDLLIERLVDYKATVHRCAPSDVEATVASLVDGRVLVPSSFDLPGATVDAGFSAVELDSFDTVVTACAAACARTGTIVLDGSPDQGRRAISLVPDRHVCVVRADQVVETVPELLARLDPTRPLTFISGPSATSDIELQRVEGVHGPRTLIVVLATP